MPTLIAVICALIWHWQYGDYLDRPLSEIPLKVLVSGGFVLLAIVGLPIAQRLERSGNRDRD